MTINKVYSLKNTLTALALLLLIVFFAAPATVSAQNKSEICKGANLTFAEDTPGKPINCATDAAGNPDPVGAPGSVNNLITSIINIFSVIVGIAAVIMVIIGGFKFITSGGDSGKVTSARNTIIYAIIGLIIVALAQIIVKFVLLKLPA